MKKVLIALALFVAVPAYAQPSPPTAPPAPTEKTLKLTDEDINYAVKMFDVCAKAQGIGCAEPAITLSKKLCAASPLLAVCEPFKK